MVWLPTGIDTEPKNLGYDDPIPDNWLAEMDAITKQLLDIFSRYEYPDIYRVGYRTSQDTTLMLGEHHVIILIHAFQRGSWEIKERLASLIIEQYRNGRISPLELIAILNMGGYWGMTIGGNSIVMVHNCRIYERKKNSSFSEISRFRAYWGLESLEQFATKAEFQLRHPEAKYAFYTNAQSQRVTKESLPFLKSMLESDYQTVGEPLQNCQE